MKWSEREDLNLRPLVPQTSALTGLRYAPNLQPETLGGPDPVASIMASRKAIGRLRCPEKAVSAEMPHSFSTRSISSRAPIRSSSTA